MRKNSYTIAILITLLITRVSAPTIFGQNNQSNQIGATYEVLSDYAGLETTITSNELNKKVEELIYFFNLLAPDAEKFQVFFSTSYPIYSYVKWEDQRQYYPDNTFGYWKKYIANRLSGKNNTKGGYLYIARHFYPLKNKVAHRIIIRYPSCCEPFSNLSPIMQSAIENRAVQLMDFDENEKRDFLDGDLDLGVPLEKCGIAEAKAIDFIISAIASEIANLPK